jgi:LmbE family N-acetylglucosaminyl deacetylase
MEAVTLVAHPDDCVIFAWPFIEHHSQLSWTVVYLTYSEDDPRAREISAYWHSRGITTKFLGFVDDYRDIENNSNSFDEVLAEQAIINACEYARLILTHNADGDYGHPHHKFVNQVADKLAIPKVYFASDFNYNKQYTTNYPVDVEELPLHRAVIEGFQDRHIGRYIVTAGADQIIRKMVE